MIAQLMETVRTLSDRLDGLTPGGRTERSRTRQRSARHREEHREHRRRRRHHSRRSPPEGGASEPRSPVRPRSPVHATPSEPSPPLQEPRRRLKGLPKGV